MPRRLLSVPLAIVVARVGVALVGVALVAYGVLLATVLAPPAHSTVHLKVDAEVAIVDTAPGVIDLDGPRLTVSATAPAGRRVFVGIGRADDVAAYLGDAPRSDITRLGDGTRSLERVGQGPPPPDPAGVDIWAVSSSAAPGPDGPARTSLEWPDTAGQWRIVVAADGTAPAAADVDLSWDPPQGATSGTGALTAGLLLLAGSAVVLLARSRQRGRRRPRAHRADPDGTVAKDADPDGTVAKDADPDGTAAKDTDPDGTAAKDTDPDGTVAKDTMEGQVQP